MKRRGFLRSLLLAPFAGLAVRMVLETLQEGASLPVTPIVKSYPELLGYKGAQFLETGYVYAPYIPLYQTCDLVNPEFVKRFAKSKIYGDYYKKITICGKDCILG